MKAIWKGYLRCSLVTIPIAMHHAIKTRSLRFHLLHKDCHTRIRQENICPTHNNKRLGPNDIVRGYQYARDTYVIITDEDLQKAQKESSDAIEITRFVDDHQVPPIYYYDSHYLVPEGKVGAGAFALFHKAMVESKKMALARLTLRNREHLLSIKPYDQILVAYTLHYPEEIQAVEKIEGFQEIDQAALDSSSLPMAKALIQNMSGDFVAGEYVDEYTETLLKLIKAKAEGQEIKVEPKAERAKVINLMEALKRSVKETEKKAGIPRKAMATAGRRAKAAPAAPRRRKAADA
jgi:DNA end-binding protein Ku